MASASPAPATNSNTVLAHYPHDGMSGDDLNALANILRLHRVAPYGHGRGCSPGFRNYRTFAVIVNYLTVPCREPEYNHARRHRCEAHLMREVGVAVSARTRSVKSAEAPLSVDVKLIVLPVRPRPAVFGHPDEPAENIDRRRLANL